MNVVDIKLMKTIDSKFSSPYKNEESDNILKKYSSSYWMLVFQ